MIQALPVQAAQLPQPGDRPVGHKTPPGAGQGQTLHGDAGGQEPGRQPLPHASALYAILQYQQPTSLFDRIQYRVRIQGRDAVILNYFCGNTFLRQRFRGIQKLIDQYAVGYQSDI